MAKGFKHGAGGGVSLSFKVVGNPQPENPKENTIWVDTDAKITGWNFNATQPDSPQEGLLWIRVGEFGAVGFNALKKNTLMVYPELVKQYINGAWVEKTAKTYLNGAWEYWIRWNVLFDYGDNEYVTGGWTVDSAYKKTVNADGSWTFSDGNMNEGEVGYANNLIDLTNYSTLHFSGRISDVSNSIKVWPGSVTPKWSNQAAEYLGKLDGETTIDISKLSGKHYIGFATYHYGTSVTIKKLWVE